MPYYACVPRHSRNTSSFFPRHPFASDFAPLFRLLDEATNEVLAGVNAVPEVRTFQPRFDVREEKDAFHLTGELPGLAQENVQIEFVDQNTLAIYGRTVSERTSGAPPAVEGPAAATSEKQIESAEKSDAPASSSSSTHQPTVEDGVDEDDFTTVSAPATPATTAAEPAKAADNTATSQEPAKKGHQQKAKYWVSERSVGQFHRSFTFPGQINQEAVTASLKDGILNVVVPKAVQKEPRKITVN